MAEIERYEARWSEEIEVPEEVAPMYEEEEEEQEEEAQSGD